MQTYQLKAHEYTCPSCTMNYAAKAENAEDAALAVYVKHYDPKGKFISHVSWDAAAHTLHTALGEYLVVENAPKAAVEEQVTEEVFVEDTTLFVEEEEEEKEVEEEPEENEFLDVFETSIL